MCFVCPVQQTRRQLASVPWGFFIQAARSKNGSCCNEFNSDVPAVSASHDGKSFPGPKLSISLMLASAASQWSRSSYECVCVYNMCIILMLAPAAGQWAPPCELFIRCIVSPAVKSAVSAVYKPLYVAPAVALTGKSSDILSNAMLVFIYLQYFLHCTRTLKTSMISARCM